MKANAYRASNTLTTGMRKNMRAVTSKETTIDFLYPNIPDRSPEKNIDIPYPTDKKMKILLAFA
jgi:hypothetical protein